MSYNPNHFMWKLVDKLPEPDTLQKIILVPVAIAVGLLLYVVVTGNLHIA